MNQLKKVAEIKKLKISPLEKAISDELKSLERQRENWESIAGHIKHIICMYDHVNDDPNKVISSINNILDDAFGYMPTAIEKILQDKGE